MSAHLDLFVLTDLVCGLLWVITYVLVARRSALDQAPGIPLLALGPALSWELIYAVVRPTGELPRFTVPVWLAVDACVLYQVLRHGPAEARRTGGAAPAWFFARAAAALAIAFLLTYTVVVDVDDRDGAWSGFAVNVVMSLAFLAMLERRRDVRGQSLYVALAKLAGSAITIPHALALHGSLVSLRAFMAVTLAGDVAYAALLHRQCRAQGIDPWRRL